MATVNKDFRVKSGLVVEGANATVNGDNIITATAAQTLSNKTVSDGFTFNDGSGNSAIYVEGNNLTVVANNDLYFNTNNGNIDLQPDGQALIWGSQIATVSYVDGLATNYDPAGAASAAQTAANSYTDTAISNAVAGLAPNYITSVSSEFDVTDGALSLNALNGSTQINPADGDQPDYGYGTIEYIDTDAGNERLKISAERGWVGAQAGGSLELHAYNDITLTTANGDIVLNPDGSSYLGSVNSSNAIATVGYVDGLASNYDAAGAASTAETNAKSYADSLASNYDPAGAASSAQTAAQSYADTVAGTAETNAKSYADSLASNYDAAGAAASALTSANSYTDTAVSNLVDGAPALLNTLNELAAAINDDASFASTIATSIGEKVAKSGDTMTGALTLSGAPTNDLHAATKKYVDDAVSGGIGILNTDDVSEGTTNLYFTSQRAIDAIGANPSFTTVDLSWVRREEAAYVAISAGQTGTAHSFTGYGTAKYLVRVYSSGHSQTSEVLVVRDASGNVAITEYGIVYTSENPLAEITADNDGGTYRLRVTAGAANVEVLTAATLLQYND
jgi:hypothetical protein